MPLREKGAIRVAIVQRDALQRDLLRVALQRAAGLTVVGWFADGAELEAALGTVGPDVAVLGLDPAGRNGVPLALRLRRLVPELGIVLLGNQRDSELLASIPQQDLQGWAYLVNHSHQGLTTLLRAIQVTYARLLDLGTPPDPGDPDGDDAFGDAREARLAGLSDRQREILALVARGLTNQAIAEALQLREKTVENQLGAIYAKLGVEGDRRRVHPRVSAALQVARGPGRRSEAA